MNINLENILDQNFLERSETKSVRLNQYSQFNIRFSPGQLWDKLSSLFFEFNINKSLNSWGSTDKQAGGLLWDIFGENPNILNSGISTTNYFIRNLHWC